MSSSEGGAICPRCGAEKESPFDPCGGCGIMPSGDARALAWLFSAQHLNPAQRAEAARRIQAGERPDPSRALRAKAQAAVGAAPEADHPLTRGEWAFLFVANLLLTPLVGYAVWFGLRPRRPRAAAQAFSLTLPVSIALAGAWGAVVLGKVW